MFKFGKDKEIDITSLNQILRTGKKIINIGYFVAIVCLILLATYVLKEWNLLKYLREVFLLTSPIFIGFLIAWFFDPFVTRLEKKNIPRIISCILVYLLFFGALFLVGYLFVPSLIHQVRDFVKVAPSIFDDVTNFTLNFIQKIDTGNLINVTSLKRNITNIITEYGLSIGSDLPHRLFSLGKSVISGGFTFILGFIIGFYLLFDFSKVNRRIYSFIPNNWKDGYTELTHRINTSLRNYIQGVFIVMLLVFVTQSIGLTIAGMEAPILFALFCAVTDIIPYFGPYIGAIPAIIVGFTVSPITGICVIISILVVQLLENNFYQPLIMGHTMKLHPVTIMMGLLIFQHFFGILGMIIATPCIACFKVIFVFLMERCEYFKYFRDREEKKGEN